jgi:hypothetical protein
MSGKSDLELFPQDQADGSVSAAHATTSWSIHDQKMAKAYVTALDAEAVVMRWLRCHGFSVSAGGVKVRRSVAEIDKNKDAGDIIVEGKGCVEVKNSSRNFTTTWPFPSIFVDTVPKVDAKIDVTWFWITVSDDLTHGAIISSRTRSGWQIIKHGAPTRYGTRQDVYAAEVGDIRFVNLLQPPKKIQEMING